jgi:membrane protease YdiL (CAAX protease family)
MSSDSTKDLKTTKTTITSSKETKLNDVRSTEKVAKAQWNPIHGILLAIVVFFGAQLLSGVLLSLYSYPKHWSKQQLLYWLDNSIGAQFLYILFAEIIIIYIVFLFVRRYKDGLRAIGLRRPKWSDPLYALACFPVYLIVYLLIVMIISHFAPGLNVNEKQQLGFNNVNGVGQMVLTFISLVILPPIGEEILFRGLIYSSLKKYLPLAGAVIGTSALFAIGHIPEGGSAGPLYIAAIDTFILSLILIYLREKTGGLWASMTLHAIKNGIAFIALFAVNFH